MKETVRVTITAVYENASGIDLTRPLTHNLLGSIQLGMLKVDGADLADSADCQVELVEESNLRVGDTVYWADPDNDKGSGYRTITAINHGTYFLEDQFGGVVEALKDELVV